MSFDSLLITTAQIYEKGAGPTDGYGIESQILNQIVANWPCRVSTNAGTGEEFKSDKEVSINRRKVFMRQPTLSNGELLDPHHVLLINEIYYDILAVLHVNDASALHHLEVIVEEVKP